MEGSQFRNGADVVREVICDGTGPSVRAERRNGEDNDLSASRIGKGSDPGRVYSNIGVSCSHFHGGRFLSVCRNACQHNKKKRKKDLHVGLHPKLYGWCSSRFADELSSCAHF